MIRYVIMLFLFYGCASKDTIQITEVHSNNDIIVTPNFDNADSVKIYIPYKFIIKNESAQKIYFSGVLPTINRNIKVFATDSLNREFKGKNKYIKSSNTYDIYIQIDESKNKVDSIYWYNISTDNLWKNQNVVRNDVNKIHNTKIFKNWKSRLENDSLTFRFTYGRLIILKTYHLKNKSVSTYTSEDLKGNR